MSVPVNRPAGSTDGLTILPVRGIGEITTGTSLAAVVHDALAGADLALAPGDVVVITSKVVSKALGLHGDPSIERGDLVLTESVRVVAERRTSTGHTRVVEAKAGPVMAGAGIDSSNADDDVRLLLPHDPDAEAGRIHGELSSLVGHGDFAVVLSDTSGRSWRGGLTDFALGCHGISPLEDLRGLADTHGHDLAVTVRNIADEVAAAADLVKGKLDRVPVAIVRGLDARFLDPQAAGARTLVRSGPTDWFALGRAEAVRDALGVAAGTPLSQQVGIESVHPEPLEDRVHRAWAVAVAPDETSQDAGLDGAGTDWTVVCADPYALGRCAARFEVALAGERLVADLTAVTDGVRVRIGDSRH